MPGEMLQRDGRGLLRPRVLLADRDAAEAGRVLRFLEGEGYEILWARTTEQAINILDEQAVDAVFAEFRGTGIDGLRLLEVARGKDPEACVVLLTDPAFEARAGRAVLAGACDFELRPAAPEKLLAALRRNQRLRRLVAEVVDLNRRLDRKYGLRNIIGNSAAIAAVLERIAQVGPTDATVLINGETGTGKELVASAIHQHSARRKGPLVKLHCGDLAEGLVESELFGHEQGAFTGATASRKGRFEVAGGGTLFLDEVGELTPGTQAKLLRVLEDREVVPVGGDRPVVTDVRVIAATQRDLRAMVREGSFREDLFYRLNVVAMEIPALRHRPQDIPLLADHFLAEARDAHGRRVPGFTSRALHRMLRYNWPGNVRQLKNVVTGMVIQAEQGRPLDARDLPPPLQAIPDEDEVLVVPIGTPWAEAERRLIEATLKSMNMDVSATARALNISMRTLYRRLAEYRGESADDISMSVD